MRLWVRVIVALVLAPIVWQSAAAYLGAAQGGSPEDLLHASGVILPKIYLAYTLPALALIVVILIPAGLLLTLIGADLLIVGVAPLLGLALPSLMSHLLNNPGLQSAATDGLAFAYGLVFGLTIREPRPRPAATAAIPGEAIPT